MCVTYPYFMNTEITKITVEKDINIIILFLI